MVVKERLDLNTYLRENNIEEPLKIKYKNKGFSVLENSTCFVLTWNGEVFRVIEKDT